MSAKEGLARAFKNTYVSLGNMCINNGKNKSISPFFKA